jgi:hypothetical protein
MKKGNSSRQVTIIVGVFIFTRILAEILGLHMSPWPLYAYWQYLSVDTLEHHLLSGIWYDHAQPPGFNLFLGVVLKIGGEKSIYLFAVIFKLISLAIGLLIFAILRKLAVADWLPMAAALIYLVSPATLIFECELFYTSIVSFLLLISVYSLILFSNSKKGVHAFGIFCPMVLLCLTRSVYHIAWLFVLSLVLLLYFRKGEGGSRIFLYSAISIVLVGGWYLKNKLIFGKFTSSTWVGMNMARNVFHDNNISDSGRIEAYEPFSRISAYRKFLDSGFEDGYKGLNDADLIQEMKNDSFINETQIGYIPVSDLYLAASLQYIKSHPGAYAKNIIQSAILYFTPATVYSLALEQADKIRAYDILYSLNGTHFAKNKHQRRILLTISAFPKMLIYILVFYFLIGQCIKSRSISAWNLYILLTIGFVFGVGSLFEHYENMRFRYETEPLFIILAAQVCHLLLVRFQKRKTVQVQKETV